MSGTGFPAQGPACRPCHGPTAGAVRSPNAEGEAGVARPAIRAPPGRRPGRAPATSGMSAALALSRGRSYASPLATTRIHGLAERGCALPAHATVWQYEEDKDDEDTAHPHTAGRANDDG